MMHSRLLRLDCSLPTLLAAILFVMPLCACGGDESSKTTIAAAASLRRVLPALIDAYGEETFDVFYAGSGTVRQQVEAGAPIDLAILAGDVHIDRLIDRGFAAANSRTRIASNALVLVGPTGGPALTFQTLSALPDSARLAMGHPKSVPAGRYAKEALQALGVWRSVEPHCVYTQDVSGVLTFVRRGEVEAGIAYRTEIERMEGVEELDRASGDWAPRPIVVGAVTSDARHEPQARKFLAFLASAKARSIFEQFGFGAP